MTEDLERSPTTNEALDEYAIIDFIKGISKSQTEKLQKAYSNDDIAAIGLNASLLAQSVKVLQNAPTSYQLGQIVAETTDRKLLYQIQDPNVQLGIELRDQSEGPDFDLLTKIDEHSSDSGPIKFDENEKISIFLQEAQYWIPPLLALQDDQLTEKIELNHKIQNLSFSGRSYFEYLVAEYASLRFDDRVIKRIVEFAVNKRVAREWALRYEMNVVDPGKTQPEDVFFAYLGALKLQIPFIEDFEVDIKSWLSILLEPLFVQFESSDPIKINAIEDLRSQVRGELNFEILHRSSHEDPLFLVQIIAGRHALAGTTRSGTTLFEAETKASSATLYNPPLIEKANMFAADAAKHKFQQQQRDEQAAVSGLHHSVSPYPAGPTGPNPAAQSYPSPHGGPRAQPQFQYGYQPLPRAQPQPKLQSFGASQIQQQQIVPQENNGGSQHTDVIVNEELIRLAQEEADQILEAPIVEDESTIDTSSKEKLNQLLNKKRIQPAEYKTAKLNNSDVQVTCYIENFAIAKATSTNKKKAGHVVAQYIINYHDYFLQRFAGR